MADNTAVDLGEHSRKSEGSKCPQMDPPRDTKKNKGVESPQMDYTLSILTFSKRIETLSMQTRDLSTVALPNIL